MSSKERYEKGILVGTGTYGEVYMAKDKQV